MRAKNMQALTNDIKTRHPGVVIYGIGDEAHKLAQSDHNEDDTPGSRPAQHDADNVPEHRAIDVMVGPKFTKDDCNRLVANLVNDASARSRLYYIIWNGRIWSRSNNWVPQPFFDDPHYDHGHFSGWAADDENGAGWPAVNGNPSPQPPQTQLRRPWPSYMLPGHFFGLITGPEESHGGYYANEREDVRAIQQRLISLGFVPGISNISSGWADGIFEQPTLDAVARWQRAKYPAYTEFYGQVWWDDWERLFTW